MKGEKRVDLLLTGGKVDKKKKRKTGSKRKKRKWSNLSEDITSLILQRLTLVDRIRFSLPCKTWRLSSTHYIQPKLPWIVEYSYPMAKPTVCLLYDPFNNGREKMTPYIAKDEKMPPPEFFSETVCASGFGWLLWSKTVYDGIKITYFYVYNPFSKKNIPLPRIKWQPRHSKRNLTIKYATFTSVPTSPECVFMVVFIPVIGDRDIFITSCSNKDTKWNTRSVMHSRKYCFHNSRITYMNGKFYFFYEKRVLSFFDLDSEEWSQLGKSWDENLSRNRPYFNRYFFSYGENLYLVENKETEDDYSNDELFNCRVYKFDWIEEVWKKMETLEGGTIFLNQDLYLPGGSSFVMSGEELGERTDQTKIAANRIYYFNPSLNPRFHIYGPQKNGNFNGNREERDMIYWDTPTSNERIWVQSPLSTP